MVLSVPESSMVPQYLQMNIGHMTSWKEEHGFIHKSVMHSQKEYANGNVHVNNCECIEAIYIRSG
jgi:hypothetical protein